MTIKNIRTGAKSDAITYDSHTFNNVLEVLAQVERLRAEILEAQTFLLSQPPSLQGIRQHKAHSLGRQRAALYLIKEWAQEAVE